VSSQNSLVELLDIQDMDLLQGGNFITDAVVSRSHNRVLAVQNFTATDAQVSQIMVVEFPALPIFYDGQANPSAIGISGTA
jgi:hypothetical protein